MDELLQSLMITRSNLQEFIDLLGSIITSLGEEYQQLPKGLVPPKEQVEIEADLAFMQSFNNLTAVQMDEYLQGKIDILKMFLYED